MRTLKQALGEKWHNHLNTVAADQKLEVEVVGEMPSKEISKKIVTKYKRRFYRDLDMYAEAKMYEDSTGEKTYVREEK